MIHPVRLPVMENARTCGVLSATAHAVGSSPAGPDRHPGGRPPGGPEATHKPYEEQRLPSAGPERRR